jgi:RTX calcium-binding nonapeptide repeat (4 copies)
MQDEVRRRQSAITAGAGDDSFYAEWGSSADGADQVSGGSGFDSAFYYSRSANLTITLDGSANDGQSGEADNVGRDVEAVTGGSGADRITGSDGSNRLRGGGGTCPATTS